jgi:hypothetical protein
MIGSGSPNENDRPEMVEVVDVDAGMLLELKS